DGNIKNYQIVGEDEFDPKTNKISWKSPMAKALLGKSTDDEVIVKRPAGDTEFIIISIKFI
ncbi:MAG: GreA/GreB family elongation factor, partial [Bdellovibrionales bacterium]|nr:GreA/GreB family elongation factor [Bdellovibrionales bacterium]